MNVLVAYTSKRGATAEIAEVVAGTLRDSGLAVHCIEAGAVRSIEPYDAVVLGSAVYIRRWHGDAKHFLRRHRKELSRRPFWIFSSGPVGDPANDDADWLEPRKIIDEAERLGTRGHVVFGGRVPVGSGWPAHGAMVENTPPEYRDRRDWDEIRRWAAGIAAELRAAVTAR